MAKKRKKQKEEEESYEFKMPEFDEEEYLRKELRETKTLFTTFVYGALIGIVSFGLTGVDVAIAALVGFIGVIFLRHIYPLVGINTALLEKKQWATNIIFYLFTWLLIWIILTNPPFSDIQGPNIKNDGIYFEEDGVWIRLTDDTKSNLTLPTNVSFNLTIVDNVEVDERSVHIIIKRENVEIVNAPMENLGDDKYRYIFRNPPATRYNYEIKAKDVNELEESLEGYFDVLN